MPSMWDATAAGAGEGIDTLLAELLKQQQVDETTRHNKAGEDISRSQLADNAAWRDMQQGEANREHLAADQDRDFSRLSTAVGRRPDGADVPTSERDRELKADVSTTGNYVAPKEESLDTIGLTPTSPDKPMDVLDMDSVKHEPVNFKWDARDPNRAAPQPTSAEQKRVTFTDGTHGIALLDPKTKTYTLPDGTDVTSKVKDQYDNPAAPFSAVQSNEGYIRFNRKSGVFEQQGADGSWEQVANPDLATPAQTRNRQDMATNVNGGIDRTMQDLDDAEKAGALGPLKGRLINEFLAGKVGTTGNDQTDELLGSLRMNMSAVRTGFASLHGRGGANVAIANEIEKQMDNGHMSYRELKGAMQAIKNWTADYAKKRGGKTGDTADSGYDPYGLLKK